MCSYFGVLVSKRSSSTPSIRARTRPGVCYDLLGRGYCDSVRWHTEKEWQKAHNAPHMTTEHISFESPLPRVLSVDGTERVLDFLNRHGGAAPDAEHEADRYAGESGWSEVHAADGYRLRCEWSKIGNERHMNLFEISPEPYVIVDDSAK